jgi:protein TonB
VRQQIVRSDTGERTEDATPDAFLGEKTRTVTRQQIKLGNSASRASAASGSESKRAAKVQLKDLALGDFSRLSRLAEREKTSTTENALSGESGEYVKGLKEGESTALNTREFVFYSFFERIRAQLDQAWEPILRAELIRHYQSGRRLASDQDHITQLVVYLARSGQVVKVEVLSESGTRLLDEAAIRAFNRAGPFPNPPQGLIGNGQSIRIQWQFILKT